MRLRCFVKPAIKPQSLQQEPESLPRFAEHYQELKALLAGALQFGAAMEWLLVVSLANALGQIPR